MRLSTGLDLAGFGLVTYAVYGWNQTAGLVIGGIFLLVISYATNDDKAIIALARIIHPVSARLRARKIRRATRRQGK